MYKVDIENKQLVEISTTTFSELDLKERFDIQEWIEKTPDILEEELLIIAKELILPSGKRLDLLAVDRQGILVIIENKRDDSGHNVEWQAIKYASYCSAFGQDDIFEIFAEYLSDDTSMARQKIEEFVDDNELNQNQRIILVARKFREDVASAVLWLRERGTDIKCVRLTPYRVSDDLLINPEVIIPQTETKDYITRRETQQQKKHTRRGSFFLEKSSLPNDELRAELLQTLKRSGRVPQEFLPAFLKIIIQEDRVYKREEIPEELHKIGIGDNVGQAGIYLSNVSQFLTNKDNPHLRQVIEFTGRKLGATKDNYRVLSQYRELLQDVLRKVYQ